MKNFSKKMNRVQKRAERHSRLALALSGEGVYEYRNHTAGDLMLPKKAISGGGPTGKVVPPGKTFIGDSYFKQMVKQKLLVELRTIESPEVKMEEKLILDQPDCVTVEGKVEQVLAQPEVVQPITEAKPEKEEEEVLLNDDALDGVEILTD